MRCTPRTFRGFALMALMTLRGSALMTLLSALALAACGKDVCKEGVGPLSEVTVTFKGFTLSQAVTLEIDSFVKGPTVMGSPREFSSRRVGRMAFPESARSGTATFVFDPGAYLMGLRLRKDSFEMIVWLRVFDGSGLLLAEGRYRVAGRTNQCWPNQKMTVSGAHTCVGKAAGDACPSRSGQPYVCKPGTTALSCEPSSCGDGFLDSQNGEICDPAHGAGHPCSDTCLPPLIEATVWERGPDWYEVDTATAPPPRYMAAGATHAQSGLFVLFGGQDEALEPLGDTWVFDGQTWTQSTLGTSPTPRHGHAMAYDSDRGVVLLFGGTDDATTNPNVASLMQDLHEFHPDTGWRDIELVGDVPQGRFRAAMAYHPGGDNVSPGFILFGGKQGGSEHARATYLLQWDLGESRYEWHRVDAPIDPAGYPPALYHHTMAWVPSKQQMWMMGGQVSDASAGNAPKTLWRFILDDTWDPGVPTPAWEAVADAGLTFDITRHQAVAGPSYGDILLVGGSPSTQDATSTARYLGMWNRTDDGWEQMLSTNLPPQRTGHVAFYLPGPNEEVDPGQGTVFTFGGRIKRDRAASAPVVPASDLWFFSNQGNPSTFVTLGTALELAANNSTDARGFYGLGQGDPADAPLDLIVNMVLADFDGDGQEEIGVGAPAYHDGSTTNPKKVGAVFVSDPISGNVVLAPDKSLLMVTGLQRDIDLPLGSWLGGALAAGDLNADGAADLVVGAPLRRSTDSTVRPDSGAVYVVFGGNERQIPVLGGVSAIEAGAAGDGPRHRALHSEAGNLALDPQGDRFGYALAVGDFNGDGYADLAVGAPLRSDGPNAIDSGAVYVLSGASAEFWPEGSATVPVNDLDPAPMVLRSATEGLRLGVSVAAGDVDGDGITDLVIGSAPSFSSDDCVPPACGAVAVLYGRKELFGAGGRELYLDSLGSPDGAVATAPGGQGDPLFGLGGVVAVVDLDLDGRGEVVAALGRPDQRTGGPYAVALIRGRGLASALAQNRDASATTHLVLRAPSEARSAGFGAWLTPGDVNGDRRVDLLIGAPFEPLSRRDLPAPAPTRAILPDAGALYVVLGSRLASYWDPHGSGEAGNILDVDDVQDWTAGDDVTFPLLRVRGGLAGGFFGASSVTGGHVTHVQLNLPPPHSQTVIFQPGWFSGSGTTAFEAFRGKLHVADLQSLLDGSLP